MNRGLLILVIEDDENDLLFLKRALNKKGLENPVHASPDGVDAMAYLEGKGDYGDREKYPFPSVLITDIKLPKGDGFQVLEWLRNHPQCAVIPVLILSGSRKVEDVRRAYRLGANAYLHKPTGLENLQRVIDLATDFWAVCEKPPIAGNGNGDGDGELVEMNERMKLRSRTPELRV